MCQSETFSSMAFLQKRVQGQPRQDVLARDEVVLRQRGLRRGRQARPQRQRDEKGDGGVASILGAVRQPYRLRGQEG